MQSKDLKEYEHQKELELNEKYKQHKKLCDGLNKLYISKNKEYGDSFGRAYKDLGMISAVAQIYHKSQRLTQIYNKDKVEYESLEDNLIDIANYALMGLLEMKRDEKC